MKRTTKTKRTAVATIAARRPATKTKGAGSRTDSTLANAKPKNNGAIYEKAMRRVGRVPAKAASWSKERAAQRERVAKQMAALQRAEKKSAAAVAKIEREWDAVSAALDGAIASGDRKRAASLKRRYDSLESKWQQLAPQRSNGLFGDAARRAGRRIARKVKTRRVMRRATRAYRRELSLEAQLDVQRRRRAEAEIDATRAARKAYKRRNPTQKAPAGVATLHKMFQGREATTRTTGAVSKHINAGHVAQLGRLSMLKIGGQTYEGFPATARLNADAKGNLIISGVKFKRPAQLTNPGEMFLAGELQKVGYITNKNHIGGGRTYDFRHQHGEEGGELPRVLIDFDGRPVIEGGTYYITAEGIRD